MKKKLNNNDRGAVLIQVALSLIAMMAFSTFVIDYGVYWESRRQTQNAADAGAMAGAVALAYDDPTDVSGVVAQSALNNGLDNPVWGKSPSIIKASDIQTPATGYLCPNDGTTTCVRVDAYRTAARGNALPIFFGQLVSLASQDVRASAVAQVGVANSSICMMPWAVLDSDGKGASGTNPYSVAADYGTQVTLKVGAGANTGGWFQATDINPPGANGYRAAIEGCVNTEYGVGDVIPPKNGNMSGPTIQGVDTVIALDPNAYWCGPATSCSPPASCGNAAGCIEGSICPAAGLASCPYGLSPRVVAVPTISPAVYYGNGNLQIDNIFGFFLEGDAGNGNQSTVTGILVREAGLVDGGKGGITLADSFVKSVYLVR